MDKVTFEGRISKMGEKLVIIIPSALKLMVKQGQKYRITLEPSQEQAENPRPKKAIKAYLGDGEIRVGDHYTAEEIKDIMKKLGFLDDLWGWYKEVESLEEIDKIAKKLEELGIDTSDLRDELSRQRFLKCVKRRKLVYEWLKTQGFDVVTEPRLQLAVMKDPDGRWVVSFLPKRKDRIEARRKAEKLGGVMRGEYIVIPLPSELQSQME